MVNLRSFIQKVSYYRKPMLRFLRKLEKNPPIRLDKIAEEVTVEVWKETDCTTCANCCKKMSPTFSGKDIRRISTYLGMSKHDFREKWLYFDKKETDLMNVSRPCQFLNLTTNLCTIYEVRPADCANFPHLTKKKMKDFIHLHKNNIQYCPATFKMVEKMMARISL